MKSRLSGAVLAVIFFMGVSGAQAATVSLNFTTLPSAQGWDFEHSTIGSHSDTTESGMFSLSDGVLAVNTIGDGLESPSGAGYARYGDVNDTNPWELSWTMRIVNYENGPTFYWGSYLAVYDGSNRVSVGYGENGLNVINDTGVKNYNFNNTVFHDYRLEYTPGGLGTWELFVDSSSVLTGSGNATTLNKLAFGDGTGAANAHWEMTAYSFTQAVPLPPALYLFSAGLLGLIGIARKRKAI